MHVGNAEAPLRGAVAVEVSGSGTTNRPTAMHTSVPTVLCTMDPSARSRLVAMLCALDPSAPSRLFSALTLHPSRRAPSLAEIENLFIRTRSDSDSLSAGCPSTLSADALTVGSSISMQCPSTARIASDSERLGEFSFEKMEKRPETDEHPNVEPFVCRPTPAAHT